MKRTLLFASLLLVAWGAGPQAQTENFFEKFLDTACPLVHQTAASFLDTKSVAAFRLSGRRTDATKKNDGHDMRLGDCLVEATASDLAFLASQTPRASDRLKHLLKKLYIVVVQRWDYTDDSKFPKTLPPLERMDPSRLRNAIHALLDILIEPGDEYNVNSVDLYLNKTLAKLLKMFDHVIDSTHEKGDLRLRCDIYERLRQNIVAVYEQSGYFRKRQAEGAADVLGARLAIVPVDGRHTPHCLMDTVRALLTSESSTPAKELTLKALASNNIGINAETTNGALVELVLPLLNDAEDMEVRDRAAEALTDHGLVTVNANRPLTSVERAVKDEVLRLLGDFRERRRAGSVENARFFEYLFHILENLLTTPLETLEGPVDSLDSDVAAGTVTDMVFDLSEDVSLDVCAGALSLLWVIATHHRNPRQREVFVGRGYGFQFGR